MPLSLPCATQASCGNKTEKPPCPASQSPDVPPPDATLFRRAGNLAANTIIFAIFIVWTLIVLLWTLVPALAAQLLPAKVTEHPRLQRCVRILITCYGRATLFLLRPWIPVRAENSRLAAQVAPCIIVANHQSFLDLYLLGAQAQANLCLVSKHWPYRLLFFFAPLMRLAGYVDIEKGTPEEVERQCLLRLRQEATLVLFPEGKRTRDGSLGRFHAGAFLLACKANVPVVPMVIYNSRQVFPVKARCFSPAPIAIKLLEAVHPKPFAQEPLAHRAMMRHTRQHFVQTLYPAPTAEKEDL